MENDSSNPYALPKIDTEFCCIVNRDKPELAATIYPYICKEDHYIAFFEFPSVLTGNPVGELKKDEFLISTTRAREAAIHIHNSIRKLRGANVLIIAGLTPDQKS